MNINELSIIKNEAIDNLQKYNNFIVRNKQSLNEALTDVGVLNKYHSEIFSFIHGSTVTVEEKVKARSVYSFVSSAINIMDSRIKKYVDLKNNKDNKQKELKQKRIENTQKLGRWKEERYGKKIE